MLHKLSVKNFRLLRDISFEPEHGKPIVLIGPNSTGKSSVIQVLDLLSRAATVGLGPALMAFGGLGALKTIGRETLSLALEVCGEKLEGSHIHIQHEFIISAMDVLGNNRGVLQSEHIDVEQYDEHHSLLETQRVLERTAPDQITLYNELLRKDETQVVAPGDMRLGFEIVRDIWRYPAVEILRQQLSKLVLFPGFQSTPTWIRDPREGLVSPWDSSVLLRTPYLDRRGLNLVNALYHLQNEHPDLWDELLDHFRAEFPFVQRIEFPADPAGGRIGLGYRDKRFPGVRMIGHQMSEGMTHFLCLLAALLSPEPATALAFDEPDVHLHPSALRRVVSLMEKASHKSAVFIATHSDRLLDHLSDPAGSIHICEAHEEQGIVLRKLDRDTLDAWRGDYSLSQLRERGHLDSSNGGSDLS